MIKKILVCGKQIYFATQKPDPHVESGTCIEVEMPIEEYWKAVDAIKEMTYLIAAGESQSEVSIVLKKVFSLAAPHAVSEKHRMWLIEKSNE